MYRRSPGALQERLAEYSRARLRLRKVVFPEEPHAEQRKREAVSCYCSQLHGLATPGRLGHLDAYEPEGFWRLDAGD